MSTLVARVRDFSDEYANVTVNIENLAGTDVWTVATGLGASFLAALEALTLGTVTEIAHRQKTQKQADSRPASDWAQREFGVRFFMSGVNSGRKSNITFPAPDMDAIDTVPGTDLAVLTDQPVLGMKNWLESNYKIVGADPVSGAENFEAVTVDRVVVIGRNS